jgi:hypothetical protein
VDPQEVLVIAFIFGGAFFVLRPIAAALAKRIAGDGPARRQDHEVSEAVLSELQTLREDVSALAERVDFTERLLARQRDVERLAAPRREGGA